MHVAQIAQRRLILVAHSLGELRIIQPFVPRELRHVLQDSQPLPNRLPPFHGHLPPLGHNVVPDMIFLCWSQPVPCRNPPLQFLPLRRSHSVEPVVILENPLLLLRTQIAESPRRWRGVRRRRPVRILVRALPGALPVSAAFRIFRTLVLPPLLLSRSRRSPLLLARFSVRLHSWRSALLHRHPTRAPALRQARRSQHRAEHRRDHPSRELESNSHALHRVKSVDSDLAPGAGSSADSDFVPAAGSGFDPGSGSG